MLRKYTRPLCKSLSRQSQREEHFGALARPDQNFGGLVKAMQRKCTRPVFKSLFGRAQRGRTLRALVWQDKDFSCFVKTILKNFTRPHPRRLVKKTAVPKAQLQMTNPNAHYMIIDFQAKHKSIQEAVSYTHLTLPTNREV